MSNVSEKLDTAKTQVIEKSEAALAAASDALESAKAGASGVIESAKAKVGSAGAKASDGIDASPVAALVGGLVLGAVAGALLPRTEREAQLLGPVGSRLTEAAKGAASAAKSAGLAALGEHGISSEAAKEQVNKLVEAVTQSATAAGSAAAGAVRKN